MQDANKKLHEFVATHSKSKEPGTIDDDTQIFEDGHLDSLGFMSLILFIEELRGRPIPQEALDLENFATIGRIVAAYL